MKGFQCNGHFMPCTLHVQTCQLSFGYYDRSMHCKLLKVHYFEMPVLKINNGCFTIQVMAEKLADPVAAEELFHTYCEEPQYQDLYINLVSN